MQAPLWQQQHWLLIYNQLYFLSHGRRRCRDQGSSGKVAQPAAFMKHYMLLDFWFDGGLVWRRWLIVLICSFSSAGVDEQSLKHLQLQIQPQIWCFWAASSFWFVLFLIFGCKGSKILAGKLQVSWTYLGFHTKSETKDFSDDCRSCLRI